MRQSAFRFSTLKTIRATSAAITANPNARSVSSTALIWRQTAQPAPGETLRYYYHENVYRPSAESHTFKEISQMGLEMLGAVGEAEVQQAVCLAAQSLAALGAEWVLEVSHMGYLFGLFGGLQPKIAAWTAAERAAAPDAHLTLAWVPHDWVRGLYFYDDFDVRFGETFYDGTWFDGVDQADLLSRITCPTVYLKAQTSYGEDGTLFAANSDEDAARVQQLIACCETTVIESGHDIHYEHPDAFAMAVNEAAGKSSGRR